VRLARPKQRVTTAKHLEFECSRTLHKGLVELWSQLPERYGCLNNCSFLNVSTASVLYLFGDRCVPRGSSEKREREMLVGKNAAVENAECKTGDSTADLLGSAVFGVTSFSLFFPSCFRAALRS